MIASLFALALAAEDGPTRIEDLPLPDPRPGRLKRPPTRFETSAFRTTTVVGDPSVSTRVAFVQDFDGPTIGELTVRAQAGWRHFGLAAEVVGTAGVSPLWSGAGVGNAVIDARWLFGRGSTHGLGLRATLAVGEREGPLGPVAWWGTVPQATLPTWGLVLAYEGATEHFAWHLHFGPRWGVWWLFGGEMIDAAASFATVQPVAPAWSIVAEVEVVASQSPVHLRGLARHDFGGGWVLDAGLAIPVIAMFEDSTLQVLGRVERRW